MFATAFLPKFALQSVLRHFPELRSRPVALLDPAEAKANLLQITEAARSRGVEPGLTASQAAARCADLIIKARSHDQENSATAVLLQTAYGFSPNIESTAAGVCTLELKRLGLETTPESLSAWGSRLLNALRNFHLEARLGIGATPGIALLAAHTANPIRIARDATEFIASLPVEALDLPPEIFEVVRNWGIRTAGALVALGKGDLAQRLGPAAIELFERLSSRSTRPLKLVQPPESFEEQMEFEAEIETIEPLRFVLRRFVEQLARRLELACLVVGELRMRLGLADGTGYEREFKIPSPTSNPETLSRILDTHLENVRTAAPINSLWLAATPAERDHHQFGLFEPALRNPNQFAQTIAQLMALCGSDRVGRPVVEATHRPDAFRLAPPEFGVDTPAAAPPSSGSLVFRGPQLRRFRPPLAASVTFEGQQPTSFRSAEVSGVVDGVRGPFVSSGDWWEDSRWSREEWDVQTSDGAMFRLFRSPEGCFIEGVYD